VLTFEFAEQPQAFDGACTELEDTIKKLCSQGDGGGVDNQFLILLVQLGQPIDENQVTGTGERWMNGYPPPKRLRQLWDRSFIGFQFKLAQLKGGDVGEIINQRHKSRE